MGRTKLRGIELAGVRIAIEAPSWCDWSWPASLRERVCLASSPDLYLALRLAMVQCLSHGRESIPMLLDDPFANYAVGPTVAINPGNADLVPADSPDQSMEDILAAAEVDVEAFAAAVTVRRRSSRTATGCA